MKTFKKVLIIAIAVLMLVGCGSKSPKSAADSFLKAVKNGDAKALQKVYYGEVETSGNTFVDNLKKEFANSNAYKNFNSSSSSGLFKSNEINIFDFDYKVKDVTEFGDQAIASVTITTENWATILEDSVNIFLPKVIVAVFDGTSSKKLEKEFKKFIKQEKKDTPDVQTDIQLPLVKTSDGWRVDASDLMDPLYQAIIGSY